MGGEQVEKSYSSLHRQRRRRLRREEASKCRLAFDIYRDPRGRPRRGNENFLVAWSFLTSNDPRFAIGEEFRSSNVAIFMVPNRNVSFGLTKLRETLCSLHRKNGFTEALKKLTGYRSENNLFGH